jgi:hypothetical protein
VKIKQTNHFLLQVGIGPREQLTRTNVLFHAAQRDPGVIRTNVLRKTMRKSLTRGKHSLSNHRSVRHTIFSLSHLVKYIHLIWPSKYCIMPCVSYSLVTFFDVTWGVSFARVSPGNGDFRQKRRSRPEKTRAPFLFSRFVKRQRSCYIILALLWAHPECSPPTL